MLSPKTPLPRDHDQASPLRTTSAARSSTGPTVQVEIEKARRDVMLACLEATVCRHNRSVKAPISESIATQEITTQAQPDLSSRTSTNAPLSATPQPQAPALSGVPADNMPPEHRMHRKTATNAAALMASEEQSPMSTPQLGAPTPLGPQTQSFDIMHSIVCQDIAKYHAEQQH